MTEISAQRKDQFCREMITRPEFKAIFADLRMALMQEWAAETNATERDRLWQEQNALWTVYNAIETRGVRAQAKETQK